MSLLWTLRKFIDPIEYAREQESQRRAREDGPVSPADDDGEPPRVDAPARPVVSYACRICDYESTADAYCPRCVAQTMVRKNR